MVASQGSFVKIKVLGFNDRAHEQRFLFTGTLILE